MKRLHEIAKEWGRTSKELLTFAKDLGLPVKSVLSALDEAALQKLKEYVQKTSETSRPVPPPAASSVPVPSPEKVSLVPEPVTEELVRDRFKVIRSTERPRSLSSDEDLERRFAALRPSSKEQMVHPSKPHVGEGKGKDRGKREREKVDRRPFTPSPAKPVVPPEKRDIEIALPITLKDLSNVLGLRVPLLMKKLIEHKILVTINDFIDEEAVTLLALEFKKNILFKTARDLREELIKKLEDVQDDAKDLLLRAPIVTMLGHVDHGKTSLLDKIRKTNVVSREAGGITQHIGAYMVELNGKLVTFLDTPGHEAFTAMRARGAHITDIAVLVVAADDGVMVQTEEALNHARAANVQVVVAINKMDKPQANPNRVKLQLSKLNVIPEEWGGNVPFCEVSALSGQGVHHLIELLILQAELMDLKANPHREALGVIIESSLSGSLGVVATLLVQNGTLQKGDTVLCGGAFGRIRAMWNYKGVPIHKAGPSMPVRITGFSMIPEVGATFYILKDPQMARTLALSWQEQLKKEQLAARRHISMQTLFEGISEQKVKEVNVVLKADVQGSIEVLRHSLINLSTDEVKVNIIHGGVGDISESDILLADASNALILGFNTSIEDRARELAKNKGIDVHIYNVIYDVINQLKLAMEGLLEPEKVEEKTGRLWVKQLFAISRFGTILGCEVREGRITRQNQIRVYRNGQKIFEGGLDSLKRFKDDVREVSQGHECGVKIAGFNEGRVGDEIEVYELKLIPRKLESAKAASAAAS